MAAIAYLAKSGNTVTFVGSQDTFDYNDFPIRPGHEEGFYRSLLECMEEQEVSLLRLDSLRENSPTLELLPEMARGLGYTVEIEQEDVTSGINLPATWDEYLGMLNKKDRHELRRKLRRLDSQTDWKWYSLSEPAQVAERLGEFLTLMRLSRADKDEFMTRSGSASFTTSRNAWPRWDNSNCSFWTRTAPPWPHPCVLTTGAPACYTIVATIPSMPILAWAFC